MGKPLHWADVVAQRVIGEKGDKDSYVCASGITPSGTIHIGNFREIITVELVARALRKRGKKVRFIYSWDDYDVFRKVPKNMPKQEMLRKHLRKPIVEVPDPFGTEESYARHHEVEIENDVKRVGIFPEFLYQAQKYRNLEYVEGIKTALQQTEKIKEILNQWRKEPLAADWYPLRGFCPSCGMDEVRFSMYDNAYGIVMHCLTCKSDLNVDIREAPFLKLPWRVDWPMRWKHEKVDFEPGGKDHSTEGSSFTTGKDIVKIYDWTAPSYIMYDFVRIKGAGGKISSSKGNVITLKDCLEVYEPAIVRYLFAGTRPNTEFAISFDLDVLKIYEDFDKLERIYYGKQEVSAKKKDKFDRMYELSCVSEPLKTMPFQPSFRHLTNVLNANELDIERTVAWYSDKISSKEDEERLRLRAVCARNWLSKYAPRDFTFTVQTEVDSAIKIPLEMKKVFHEVATLLRSKDWKDNDLHEAFYEIVREKHKLEMKDFFLFAYRVLINKEKGPQLASFILLLGQKRVAALFEKV